MRPSPDLMKLNSLSAGRESGQSKTYRVTSFTSSPSSRKAWGNFTGGGKSVERENWVECSAPVSLSSLRR